MPRPTLSVVVATSNGGDDAVATLEALRAQSVRPDEMVMVDAASSDLFAAYEQGIAQTRGECLYLARAGDVVDSEFVESELAALAAHPDAGLCCSDPISVDGNNGHRVEPLRWWRSTRFLSPRALARRMDGGAIADHTVIVRRAALQAAGGRRRALKSHASWFAWLVIGFRCGVCYIPRRLATAPVHAARGLDEDRGNPQTQADVFRALFTLLKDNEHGDVLPLFVRGDVLDVHGADLVRWLLAEGINDEVMLALARRPIRRWARVGELAHASGLASATFEMQSGRWWTALREMVKAVRSSPNDAELGERIAEARTAVKEPRPVAAESGPGKTNGRVCRVAVFGAGEHGQTAMELASRRGWEVRFFIDKAADRLGPLAERAVIRPEALDAGAVDLVIVASVASRDEMFAHAARRGYRPGAEVIWFLDDVMVGHQSR
jgi:hypothetical protein